MSLLVLSMGDVLACNFPVNVQQTNPENTWTGSFWSIQFQKRIVLTLSPKQSFWQFFLEKNGILPLHCTLDLLQSFSYVRGLFNPGV